MQTQRRTCVTTTLWAVKEISLDLKHDSESELSRSAIGSASHAR